MSAVLPRKSWLAAVVLKCHDLTRLSLSPSRRMAPERPAGDDTHQGRYGGTAPSSIAGGSGAPASIADASASCACAAICSGPSAADVTPGKAREADPPSFSVIGWLGDRDEIPHVHVPHRCGGKSQPAPRQIERSVPGLMSPLWFDTTTTRPALENTRCDPLPGRSVHPSRRSRFITSRGVTSTFRPPPGSTRCSLAQVVKRPPDHRSLALEPLHAPRPHMRGGRGQPAPRATRPLPGLRPRALPTTAKPGVLISASSRKIIHTSSMAAVAAHSVVLRGLYLAPARLGSSRQRPT